MNKGLVEQYTKTVSGTLFGVDADAQIELTKVYDVPDDNLVAFNGNFMSGNYSLATLTFNDVTIKPDPDIVASVYDTPSRHTFTDHEAQRFALLVAVNNIGQKLGAALFKKTGPDEFDPSVNIQFIQTDSGLAVESFTVSVKGIANNSPLWTNYAPLAEP
jgi:hypothetical protein